MVLCHDRWLLVAQSFAEAFRLWQHIVSTMTLEEMFDYSLVELWADCTVPHGNIIRHQKMSNDILYACHQTLKSLQTDEQVKNPWRHDVHRNCGGVVSHIPTGILDNTAWFYGYVCDPKLDEGWSKYMICYSCYHETRILMSSMALINSYPWFVFNLLN